MIIALNGTDIIFLDIPLIIMRENISSVYYHKNNKTLSETLNSPKYARFKPIFSETAKDDFTLPLGEFLKLLKESGNENYRCFLNKNGNRNFCTFKISEHLSDKGLYCFYADNEIKYIGRCTDNFKKRINDGYGTIHPKNCFVDGQSTNCRINSLINENINAAPQIKFGVYIMSDQTTDQIKALESRILSTHSFPWNAQTNSS